uniref:Uncharacterized protein n=1 Tax=Anguilla anguilla TaxID=7936 RepID=A0A0E9S2X2_ANGAN
MLHFEIYYGRCTLSSLLSGTPCKACFSPEEGLFLVGFHRKTWPENELRSFTRCGRKWGRKLAGSFNGL